MGCFFMEQTLRLLGYIGGISRVVMIIVIIIMEAYRVVGNIWCFGAGETCSHTVREANSSSP